MTTHELMVILARAKEIALDYQWYELPTTREMLECVFDSLIQAVNESGDESDAQEKKGGGK